MQISACISISKDPYLELDTFHTSRAFFPQHPMIHMDNNLDGDAQVRHCWILIIPLNGFLIGYVLHRIFPPEYLNDQVLVILIILFRQKHSLDTKHFYMGQFVIRHFMTPSHLIYSSKKLQGRGVASYISTSDQPLHTPS